MRSGWLSAPQEGRHYDLREITGVSLLHQRINTGDGARSFYHVQLLRGPGLPLNLPGRSAVARRLAAFLQIPLKQQEFDPDNAMAQALGGLAMDVARSAFTGKPPEAMPKAQALALARAEIAASPESGAAHERLAALLLHGAPEPAPALSALQHAQALYEAQERSADATQAADAARALADYIAEGGASGSPAALDHLARCRQLLEARLRSQATAARQEIAPGLTL
jgi:hypothetical protein